VRLSHSNEIDAFLALLYSYRMSDSTPQSVTEQELQKLEARLEELVRSIERLKEENRSLRNQQDSLVTERANLIEKNELARTRVEAMINRLKAMEQGA
jgi:cell division protein ZapB